MNIKVKTLLDSEDTVSIISQSCISKNNIPKVTREQALIVRDFSGKIVPGVGEVYSFPLLLNHNNHYTMETFEISELDEEFDIILPWWWIVRYKPVRLG